MIFYCETKLFSGQERMFLTGACFISKKEKSILIINKENKAGIDFAKTEGDFKNIKYVDDFNDKFSSLVIWFRWVKILKLYRYLLKHNDVLCVSQGRIESGNIGIIAAKLARRRVISYIPMVHTHIEMSGKKTINVIKDLLCKPLYKFPDCFITISNAVKKELSNHTSGNIKVVENFVQQKEPVQIADVPPALYDEYIYKIVIPGRLINKQKGQLDFIQSFEKIQRKVNKKLICYIIGDGPDYELFSNEIVTRKLEGSVILLGNRNDLLGIMKKSNLIVLPSRFEGVPLVLLEAASFNLKIIASDIVGFNDYLNPENLFKPYNIDSITEKTVEFINSVENGVGYKQALFNLLDRNVTHFVNDFYNAVLAQKS